ncbi:hypothetical protein JCM3770_004359 [Rhodotorula araucariae]
MFSLLTSPVSRCTSLVTRTVGTCAYWLAEQAIHSLVTAQNPPPPRTSLASSDFFARPHATAAPLKVAPGSRRGGTSQVKVASLVPPVKPVAAIKPVTAPTRHAARLFSRSNLAPPPTTAPGAPPRVPTAHTPTVSCLRKKTALRAWLKEHALELDSQAALKAARVHGEALIAREEPYERALEAAAARSSRTSRDLQRRERQTARISGQMDAYLADVRGVQPVYEVDPSSLNRACAFTAPPPSSLGTDCTAAVVAPTSRAAKFAAASRASIRAAHASSGGRGAKAAARGLLMDALVGAHSARRPVSCA